jgi:hypothetical protein
MIEFIIGHCLVDFARVHDNYLLSCLPINEIKLSHGPGRRKWQKTFGTLGKIGDPISRSGAVGWSAWTDSECIAR